MKTFLNHINELYEADTLGKPSDEDHFYCTTIKDFTGSNQATIRLHKNYNGSGPNAFGGATEWGHITLSIAVPAEVSNKDGQAILTDIRLLLEKYNYKKKN